MKKLLIIVVLLAVVAALGYFFFQQKSKGTVPSQQEAPISTASYSCDGPVSVTASFYQGAATATTTPGMPPTPSGSVSLIVNNGALLSLPQTISADGGRFANADESVVFWDKGNTALFQQAGQKDFANCVKIADDSTGLSQLYASTTAFSLRYPADFTVHEPYLYEALGPGKGISGVKFTIPATLAEGTNLSSDSYISVEQIAAGSECDATLFLQTGTASQKVDEGDTTYSIASSTDAGAGNRYHEIVYALPGTNPCRAVRYFIHYGVFENYPAGTIKEFDEAALIKQFDAIRKTLILAS